MAKQVSSKKFKTTVVSLCLGFLMVVGAVIGVWAASTQNYKAGFNVSYSVGDNVAAKVRTEYYVPNADYDSNGVEDGAHTVTTNEAGDTVTGEDGYVTFNAGDSNETGAEVYIGNFNLTPQTPKIIFYFTVYNMLEEGYLQVVVDEDYTTKENVSVKTTYVNPESFALSSSASTMSVDDYTNKQYDNASAQGYKIVKVEIAVKNQNASAAIAGDIALGLYYHEETESASLISKEKFVAERQYRDTLLFDYAQRDSSYPTTGTDVSEAGDCSIWMVNNRVYSYNTIVLPEDSSSMFESLGGDIIFNNINTSKVTDMSCMFQDYAGDTPLTLLDLSMFDTSNVTDMSDMFFQCRIRQIDVSSFNTSKVTDMSSMFIAMITSIDVSHFDTSSVTAMSCMFENGYFTSLDLSGWDTSKVTDMSSMFNYCSNLTSLNLSGWDTSKVTNMSNMFANCSNLTSLDLSNWDTSKVTDMSNMFELCESLTTIYVGSLWSTDKVTYSSNMFYYCTSLQGAVAYNSSKIDVSMANWETGYLTLKQ